MSSLRQIAALPCFFFTICSDPMLFIDAQRNTFNCRPAWQICWLGLHKMTLQSGAQPAFCRAESKAICRPVACGLSFPSFQFTPLGRAKAMKTHPSVAWLQEGYRNRFLLKPAVSQGLEIWSDIKSGSCWRGTYPLCKTCFLSFCKTFRISVGKCHGQVFSRMPFCMPLILKKRDFASSESFW